MSFEIIFLREFKRKYIQRVSLVEQLWCKVLIKYGTSRTNSKNKHYYNPQKYKAHHLSKKKLIICN